MNNELICTPVMIPAPIGIYGNCLVKQGDRIFLSAGESKASSAIRRPQHLYLVSDEEIKEGDYYFIGNSRASNHGIVKAESIEEAKSRNDLNSLMDKNEGTKDFVFCKRIEATTDKSLSLPLIPSSFIERWVNEQGKIDKVRVLSHNGIPVTFNNSETEQHVVNILPIEDKTYSREEVKAIMSKYISTYNAATPTFNEWFDLNY